MSQVKYYTPYTAIKIKAVMCKEHAKNERKQLKAMRCLLLKLLQLLVTITFLKPFKTTAKKNNKKILKRSFKKKSKL